MLTKSLPAHESKLLSKMTRVFSNSFSCAVALNKLTSTRPIYMHLYTRNLTDDNTPIMFDVFTVCNQRKNVNNVSCGSKKHCQLLTITYGQKTHCHAAARAMSRNLTEQKFLISYCRM